MTQAAHTRAGRSKRRAAAQAAKRRNGKTRGIVYVRVSQRDGREGESYISPIEQIERCRALAHSQGIKIVDEIIEEDVSGGDSTREGLQRSLTMVEDKDADVIIVAYLSRFARSVKEMANSTERLADAGGGLLSCDPITDTRDTSATGKLIRHIFWAIDQMVIDSAAEKYADAQQRAIARGVKIASTPPFGYRFKRTSKDKRKRDSTLVEHPVEAEVMREVFRRKAAGVSTRSLVDFIREQTGRSFYVQTVNRMIANRVYRGEVYFAEFENKHAHDPLVTEDEWQAAQASTRRSPFRKNGTALLSGIMSCKSCGRVLVYNSKRTVPSVYVCQSQRASGKCKAPLAILASKADEYVESVVLEWAREAKLDRKAVKLTSARERELSLAQARVTAAQNEHDSFILNTAHAGISRELLQQGIDERKEALADAQRTLRELERQERSQDVRKVIRDEWQSLSASDKNELLQVAVERCVLHPSVDPVRFPGRRLTKAIDRIVVTLANID